MAGHKCSYWTPSKLYGEAVISCVEDSDGALWVDNGEYASRVNYCPFCGYKAGKQMDSAEMEVCKSDSCYKSLKEK